MLNIIGNAIELTRGDTAYLTVPITIEGEPYTMSADDRLTLSVKQNVKEDVYCFQKVSVGNNVIHIEPADTKSMEFKKYKYDVQLNRANGDVFTVVPTDTFEVLSEVTCE